MVLKCELEKNLEQQFRQAAMKRYGYMKGSLQKATREAVTYWVAQQSEKLSKVDDPFALVEGILHRIRGKKTSVELQHEAQSLWIR